MKEHKFPLESLIGGWYIDPVVCDAIMLYFNANRDITGPGFAGEYFNEDSKVKESIDLGISINQYHEPFISYMDQLNRALHFYKKRYMIDDLLFCFNIDDVFNIQYYEKNKGYYVDHIENDGKNSALHRCLVFMTYLNDVSDGGTIFKNQKITTPAKQGLTLFWPAYYSHIHRGQISKTSDKYIVTGWYSFEKNDK